jgi:hypothetical protein
MPLEMPVLQGFLGTRRQGPAEQYANVPHKSVENPWTKPALFRQTKAA